MSLIESFSRFGKWRNETIDAVTRLHGWLSNNELGDAQAEMRLQYLLERLRSDKLTVAFVAEFSRGKSELINAVFFSDRGDRILPSSSGRTTMCPTELMWSPGDRPEISLLPIATRASSDSIASLKGRPDQWVSEPLDTSSAAVLQRAMARVGETRRISQDEARGLGFDVDPDGRHGLKPDSLGLVEVPSWRHAVIRFPHPLLEKGLVVLDTPGLNAIGAEPELTLALLPAADAVLFVLAADSGVTQSDLAVWREFVEGDRRRRGRLVVLNKIDSLWDGLRNEDQIDREINRQVASVAGTLAVEPSVVFPLSAQKGLVARIQNNPELLARSRLPRLEQALGVDLLNVRQEIFRENVLGETDDLVAQANALLNTRLESLSEQLQELTDLRGKNQNVIEYMIRKIRTEKEEFEQGLQRYYAVRSVFTTQTNKLLAHLGLDAVRSETRRTREAMLESTFSSGLSAAMEGFFRGLRANLSRSSDEVAEISSMLGAMYKRFSVEHGMELPTPESFSVSRYERQLDRLEAAFNRQINSALVLVTTEKSTITQRFFETIALQARQLFEAANRDVEHWLRAVMAPLETQVREYQMQLRRRLESVKKIHKATDTLDERVEELSQSCAHVKVQLDELSALSDSIRRAVVPDDEGGAASGAGGLSGRLPESSRPHSAAA